MKFRILLLILLSAIASFAQTDKSESDDSGDETSKSNNPLADLNSINLTNYYYSRIEGTTESGNALLIRGVMVSGRQIVRATLPVTHIPTTEGYKSGLGDFVIFDAIKLTGDSAKTEFGIGPLAVLPTASSKYLGSGKWQLGAAAVVIRPIQGGHLLGSLITYQHSIFGDDDRSTVSKLNFQPILTVNIGKGLYGRSSGAIWAFDFENNTANIPLGVGVGKIIKMGKTIVNIFIEPEFTVYSEGENQPVYQVLTGLNFQWAKK